MSYQLAQVNIARPLAPIDGDVMREFVMNLDPINAIADRSPGFVWRLQTEDGNATAISVFGDLMINMSVWTDIESLSAYVYRSHHRDFMMRRREWFARLGEIFVALWWVPEGHRPTVAEAEERLLHLRRQGPSERAFTFRRLFPAPGTRDIPDLDDDLRGCPA